MTEKSDCTAQVKAYVTPAEAERITELAKADGRTVSSFCRRALVGITGNQ